MLLITFFGYFAIKVWDIDFWGHIAAGKQILASGAIPSQDPFGIYSVVDSWGQTVLKSQWLGQVLLYSVYNFSGLDGVILLRATILTLCIGIVYWRCRIAGANLLFTLTMLGLTGLVMLLFTGERPQLFSFLYISLVFLLLDKHVQNSSRWPLYLIPLIFLLWANMHGGVLFGEVALGLFAFGCLLETRMATGKFHIVQVRLLLVIAGLSAFASLLTPNGANTLTSSLKVIIFPQNNPIHDRISEYATPWAMWPTTVYYWVFFAVFLLSLPGFFGKYGKQNIKHAVVACAVAIFSLTGSRYVPLFALLTAPYAAAGLTRVFCNIKMPSALTVSLSAMVIALSFFIYGVRQDRVFQHGLLETRFPVEAVSIIKENHLNGNMFNSMNWGGYLIWNLPPTVRVFIDGRTLDTSRLVPYTHILWMTPEGRSFFDQAGFNLVLVQHGNDFTGERYSIISYLLSNPYWRVIYRDKTGYLFARMGAS
jgi:hypothetical protein